MATPREILIAAHAKSSKNNPGKIATQETELLEVFKRAFRGLWTVGVRVNPEFFGDQDTVAPSNGTWARPADAMLIFFVEKGTGEEVDVIPLEERNSNPTGTPSIYRLGQVYRPAGTDPGPGDSLVFFFGRRPTMPADLDTAIDSAWPEDYNELLVNECAIYLAIKDGRAEEIEGLIAARDHWLALFVSFLETETVNVVGRFNRTRRIEEASQVPLTSLLAGTR